MSRPIIPSIPIPPRTPPPSDDPEDGMQSIHGLGLMARTPTITTDHDYDIAQGFGEEPTAVPESTDSHDFPMSAMLSPARASFASDALSPARSVYSPMISHAANGGGSSAQAPAHNPFNFTPVQYTAGVGMGAGASRNSDALGKRKGHKYRHSSIHASAMDSIIQAPAPRTPLAVPASLPVPTRKEAWRSLTREQTSRLSWCACHFFIAGYVQFSGAGSLAMTALSRLLLFDAAGATACVAVDVMANFEVWKRSSIKHPFGLERADVLAGFGMAVFISFMGLDVISHGIEHSLENVGAHEPHTSHAHGRVSAGRIDFASLLAIGSTLVSALLLKNHARIGKATRLTLIAAGGRVLGNPSHVLTLSCSVLLLALPWLGPRSYEVVDLALSLLIATLMIAFGVRLGTSLASMLLMSYQPAQADRRVVHQVLTDIAADPSVGAIDEARFWQVHYGLCMANLKLRYRGSAADDMARIRQRISSLIRQRLGGKWEVSMQMTADRD